ADRPRRGRCGRAGHALPLSPTGAAVRAPYRIPRVRRDRPRAHVGISLLAPARLAAARAFRLARRLLRRTRAGRRAILELGDRGGGTHDRGAAAWSTRRR